DLLRERAKQKKREEEKRMETLKKEAEEKIEEKKKKSRKISIIEGGFAAVSGTISERYISPFALSLGATNAQIGFLSAFPTLIGNFTQLFSHKVLERYSRKKIMVFGTTLQSILWLFILFAAVLFFIFKLSSNFSVVYLIIVYSGFVAIGNFIIPIWNSLMKDIVTKESGKYFGVRNKIINIVSLAVLLLSGFLLDYFKKTKIYLGFFILFSCAAVARFVSSRLFFEKYEPKLQIKKEHYFTIFQFIKKMRHNNFGRFVIAISLMNFAISIASPFFVVYMLKDLGFDYVTYTLIVSSSILGTLIFMPLWGKFIDHYGTVKTIRITSLFTCTIPLGWFLFSFLPKSFALVFFLIFIEFCSGVIFSGFSLATSNFIYDAVTRERMALCQSYFNVITSIAVFAGTSLGSVIVSSRFFAFFGSVFLTVFLISGILRILISLTLVPKFNEVRMVKPFKFIDVKEKIKHFRKRFFIEIFSFKAE
ncbi:MAG: MFS transporter, partial [Candidatus Pacearchaeota archaeon]|nr:MFS transporter [Candidatus Pacearchaeota archaeon]